MNYRGHEFEYDSINNTILMDGVVVYREDNAGEVSVERCNAGEEFWESGETFTFDDFITEIVAPMLEERGDL